MKRCFDFLGEEVSGGTTDRVFIVPVPVEYSTSYVRGTARAPDAIIDASRQVELYNPSLPFDLEGTGIVTLRPGINSKKDLIDFIQGHVNSAPQVFPCFIGGEHSITPWILEGLARTDIGIVWLDAHADLRPEYLGERESHACAARNSLHYGPVVEIGVRSYSREEHEFMIEQDDVKVFAGWDGNAREAVAALPDRVYLSLDFDAMDPSVVRAVGTPEPGGLLWDEYLDLLTFLFDEKWVVGMDAVELCPSDNDTASTFIAARAIVEAVSRWLKGGRRG